MTMDLLSLFQRQNLKANQTARLSCPFCYAKDTFTVTKKSGAFVWNCYRVSCKRAGATPYKRDEGDIRDVLSVNQERHKLDTKPGNFVVPAYWASISGHDGCIKLLAKYNCLQAYYDRAFECRYDPKLNRLVFLIKDDQGSIVDAVGYSIIRGNGPKCKRYGNCDGYFNVSGLGGPNRWALVVEDCYSAVSARAVGLTGVALLGTHLNHPEWFSKFSRVYLALDPDASRHSLKLAKKLWPYTEVRIRFLSDDPKNLSVGQLKEQLKLT